MHSVPFFPSTNYLTNIYPQENLIHTTNNEEIQTNKHIDIQDIN
jgi:hypothetical protein